MFYDPKFVEDIQIRVVKCEARCYDVYLRRSGEMEVAVVFTTESRNKALAVAEYLSTMPREMLSQMINDKRKEDDLK